MHPTTGYATPPFQVIGPMPLACLTHNTDLNGNFVGISWAVPRHITGICGFTTLTLQFSVDIVQTTTLYTVLVLVYAHMWSQRVSTQ